MIPLVRSSSSYCFAISGNNTERRIEQRVMIRRQPERQAKYGRDDTQRTRMFGRADRDSDSGESARGGEDGKGLAVLEANAKDTNGGLAGNRKDSRLPIVGGMRKIPEANEAGMVDCGRSDLRTDGRGHFGGARVRAGQERSREAVASVTPDRLIARCGRPAEDVTKEVYPILVRTISYQPKDNEKLVFVFSRTAEEKSDWVFLTMKDESGARSYDTPEAKIAALPCLDSKK